MKISQNFVAFSEYMNFDYVPAELFMFPHLLGSPKIHPFGFEARQKSAGFSSIFLLCFALWPMQEMHITLLRSGSEWPFDQA
mgnify:CR=1 FL=1